MPVHVNGNSWPGNSWPNIYDLNGGDFGVEGAPLRERPYLTRREVNLVHGGVSGGFRSRIRIILLGEPDFPER
jgi:hypothetical protein